MRWTSLLLLVGVLGLGVVAVLVRGRDDAPDCTRSLRSGSGSLSAFVASLGQGATGCLSGHFVEDLTIRNGGFTLRSSPGARASIRGRLYVSDSANDVVVADLVLDGRNAERLPSPTITGDRVVFREVDVTNGHKGICFAIGSSTGFGVAVDTVIERSRIHDCGRLPPTNHDHGIYLESSRNAVVRDNYVYGNADRGIQLFPDAQGSLIEHNVIDGNGEGILFAGGGGKASSGNVVRDNIVSNSTERHNVEANWPPSNPVGTGNVVLENCLWLGAQGNIGEQLGFAAEKNTDADPGYADRADGDFALERGSPCAGYGPR
jgi:parallel beta-helix repeat protein